MTEQFKWVDYYEEFASKLLEYRNNRKELIDKLVKVFDSIEMKLPKLEANGIPEDIDPFTVFGLFNKGITNDNRISILEGIAKEFSISSEVPHDFDGIRWEENFNQKSALRGVHKPRYRGVIRLFDFTPIY